MENRVVLAICQEMARGWRCPIVRHMTAVRVKSYINDPEPRACSVYKGRVVSLGKSWVWDMLAYTCPGPHLDLDYNDVYVQRRQRPHGT